MPPITAAAARTATITPLPPPSLFSVLRTAPTRFTLDAPTALAAGAAAAITGALTKEAAAIAASEILPKRIVMLLIFHSSAGHSGRLIHNENATSTLESMQISKNTIFFVMLQIAHSLIFAADFQPAM
jgi:hypothetical protein